MNVDGVLALILPLIVLQLALLLVAIFDLTRPDRRVRGDNKVVWAIIIVALQLIGPLAYFLFGREEG
jgi:hypothetical protein